MYHSIINQNTLFMKKKVLFILTSVIFLLLMTVTTKAQDMCATNPSHCKLLNDTAGMKMMIITLKPGDRLVSHTHPLNFVYVLKGGLYKWTYTNGKTESMNLKAGDHFVGPPEDAHKSWNAGKTTIQILFFEKNS